MFPGFPARISDMRNRFSALWSLKTTRCGYKVNMAAMEEGKIDFVVRIRREQGKS